MKNPLGITGHIKAVKNKITKPFQECDFQLLYDEGLTKEYGLTSAFIKEGRATSPSKGWYSLDGDSKSRSADLDFIIGEKLKSGEIN